MLVDDTESNVAVEFESVVVTNACDCNGNDDDMLFVVDGCVR